MDIDIVKRLLRAIEMNMQEGGETIDYVIQHSSYRVGTFLDKWQDQPNAEEQFFIFDFLKPEVGHWLGLSAGEDPQAARQAKSKSLPARVITCAGFCLVGDL